MEGDSQPSRRHMPKEGLRELEWSAKHYSSRSSSHFHSKTTSSSSHGLDHKGSRDSGKGDRQTKKQWFTHLVDFEVGESASVHRASMVPAQTLAQATQAPGSVLDPGPLQVLILRYWQLLQILLQALQAAMGNMQYKFPGKHPFQPPGWVGSGSCPNPLAYSLRFTSGAAFSAQ